MKKHVTQYNDTMVVSGTKKYQALVATIIVTLCNFELPQIKVDNTFATVWKLGKICGN